MVCIKIVSPQVLFHILETNIKPHQVKYNMLLQISRKLIGGIILGLDKITSPKPPTRSIEEQTRLDELTSSLTLYEMLACPFCVKVRREIKRLGLNIECHDVKRDQNHMQDLVNGGGKFQVPCLCISEQGNTKWLYESDDIIKHLRQL